MSEATRRRSGAPVVGILAGRAPAARYSLHQGYVDSLAAVGASPIILPLGPSTDLDRLLTQVLVCDAILVSGGSDVDPALSGIADPSEAKDVDRARDDAEIAAIHEAIGSGRPVLGICRGAQVLAVAFGGSLLGDLPRAGLKGHDELAREYEPVHRVHAEPGSVAAVVLGSTTEVNSAHHQASRSPAPTTGRPPGAPTG